MRKMKKLRNIYRTKKIIENTIDSLSLNLSGMTVLTEVGSGAFVVTSLIAALAHADKVYTVVRDSGYGKRKDVIQYLYDIITAVNIDNDVVEVINDPIQVAHEVNIVTNLGFVRPINEALISKLPKDAAIPLMYETWETRAGDIDFDACERRSIPVLGTYESDNRLLIFRYVGMLALKLLLETEIEVFESNIVLISSGIFLDEINEVLSDNGANIKCYNPYERVITNELREFLRTTDAIVVAEQICEEVLISDTNQHITIDDLQNNNPQIIHISGVIDHNAIDEARLPIHPQKRVKHGYMTVTTDYVGVTPVIKLHTAGLKVGQAMVEGLRKHGNITDAKAYALLNSPAMDVVNIRIDRN
jgi:hypothetical protein